jgi:hypothetical protein
LAVRLPVQVPTRSAAAKVVVEVDVDLVRVPVKVADPLAVPVQEGKRGKKGTF